jgi:DNA-directed RNA polymerase specialized sigma24 family protein
MYDLELNNQAYQSVMLILLNKLSKNTKIRTGTLDGNTKNKKMRRLTSEAFIKAFRAIIENQFEEAKFSTYFYRIVYNTAIDNYKPSDV